MAQQQFEDARVAAVFAAYRRDVRDRLLALRALIFATAAETAGVGPLVEALKWGQPSYITAATGSGSTIRIDQVKADPGRYALYFNCRTTLVESFRALYPGAMAYAGSREISFGVDDAVPLPELRHCLALALTYHRAGRRAAA
jgi:hypothetical protein